MTTYVNECVGCDIPCEDCGAKRVPVTMCDKCGCIDDEFYMIDGKELCLDCLSEEVYQKMTSMDLECFTEMYNEIFNKNEEVPEYLDEGELSDFINECTVEDLEKILMW